MLGFGVLFAGLVLTTAGASVITLEPVVPVSPPSQQEPTVPTGSRTKTTNGTTGDTTETKKPTKTTGAATEDGSTDVDTPTPGGTEPGDGDGGGGAPGTEGMGQPGHGRAPVHPVAAEENAQTQLNTFGAVPMWIGIATQFVGLMTAVFTCLTAWAKAKPSVQESRSSGRIDRKRRS